MRAFCLRYEMRTHNKKTIGERSLYLVLSEEYGAGRSVMSIAEEAVAGGVDILQMREKHKSREDLLRLGSALGELCRKNNVTFIVNDDPLLAAELDADGVHMGQKDLQGCPLDEVRGLSESTGSSVCPRIPWISFKGQTRWMSIISPSVQSFRRRQGTIPSGRQTSGKHSA